LPNRDRDARDAPREGSGAVNPTLTIIANALRVGDHIARRLGA
jgi:hypothetical protein